MNHKKEKTTDLYIPLSLIAIAIFLVLNLALIYFLHTLTRAVSASRKEHLLLIKTNQAMQISLSAYNQYKTRILALEEVFPDEESISDFIQLLEEGVRSSTNDYKFRFASLTPIPEQEKLYLLLNLTVKTEFPTLLSTLQNIESLPYMTHIVSVSAKNNQGFTGQAEYLISLKVYVKKPFSIK